VKEDRNKISKDKDIYAVLCPPKQDPCDDDEEIKYLWNAAVKT